MLGRYLVITELSSSGRYLWYRGSTDLQPRYYHYDDDDDDDDGTSACAGIGT